MTTLMALAAGLLAADPEPRTSANGKTFCKAVLKHVDGDATTWVRVVAFGALAEELAALRKGDAVGVAGRLKTSAYTDKQQQPAASIEIVVDRLIAMGTASAPNQRRNTRPTHQPAQEA